ncbi:unnamed protein product [Ectocarpus sp. CCAP 1310/34]|nr:unnamed protein product [Ectocarpus sp. CCAP 1310/34]
MVKIMLPPASFQQPALGDDCDEGGHYLKAVAPGGDLGKAPARNQLAKDPSACTFWCAVALGALAKGNPIESVTSYAQLAEEALSNSRSGPGDAEVAKAWVILANLHGFMGDKGFAEIVKSKDIANVSCGKWQVEPFPVQEETVSPPQVCALVASRGRLAMHILKPEYVMSWVLLYLKWQVTDSPTLPLHSRLSRRSQLNEAATEVELYRYLSQSCAAFEKAIYTTATEQSASGTNSLCDSELHGRPDVVPASLEDLMAADISKAMRTLLEDDGFVDFGPLQEAVDRETCGQGEADLTFQGFIEARAIACKPIARIGSIFNVYFPLRPALTFPYNRWYTSQSQLTRTSNWGAVSSVTRSSIRLGIGVLFINGYHMAHILLICLAAAGGSNDQAMYARIRVILNYFRPPGSHPVPPFVEWRGVGAFCDEISCRSIEGLIPCGHVRPFLEPPVDDIDADFGTKVTGSNIDEDAPHGHGFTQREILPAFNSIPGKIIGTAPVWPTDSGVESDIGPTLVPTAPPTTSRTSSNRAFYQSEAGLHSVGVARGVTTPEPSALGLSESSERDWKPEDTDEVDIAEEDWLDVAHAISDAAETV